MEGRDWFEIRRRSCVRELALVSGRNEGEGRALKPLVTTKACSAPFRSSRQLVATVVDSLQWFMSVRGTIHDRKLTEYTRS